jgi:hypothetical protein
MLMTITILIIIIVIMCKLQSSSSMKDHDLVSEQSELCGFSKNIAAVEEV